MQFDREILFENMFNALKSYYAGFCTGLQETIRRHSEIQFYHKNSTILEYGQVCKSCFFALQGLVVARFMHDGNEKVSWFMGAGDVIIAVDSFYRQTPSTEKLVALMDVICISLPNEALQKIYHEFPEFNIVGRRLTEEYYIKSMERNKWVSFSARERYKLLLEQYPRLFQHVGNADMATYLGVDKSTLYRIKKSESRKK